MTKSRVCESMCDHLEKNAAIIVAKLEGQKSIGEECSAPSPWQHRLFLRLPATLLEKQVFWLVRAWEFTSPGIISRPYSLAWQVGTMLRLCFLCSQSASFPSTEGTLSVQHLLWCLSNPFNSGVPTCWDTNTQGFCFSSNCANCVLSIAVSPWKWALMTKWRRIEFHEGGT